MDWDGIAFESAIESTREQITTKQNNTKQNKTKQNKTKQNKTKPYKTIQLEKHRPIKIALHTLKRTLKTLRRAL